MSGPDTTPGAGSSMWKGLGAVALLVLAGWMLFGRTGGPRIDLGPYRALGVGVADEVRKLVPGGGTVVLVIPDPEGDPVLEAQVRAFRGAMGSGGGGVQLGAVEKVVLDPMTRMQTGGAIPGDRYLALRTKHAGAAAWVLFMPFPALDEAALAGLSGSKAKVVVVSPAMPGYDAALKAGAFHVAVVPKPDAAEGGPAGETDQARFAREYQVLR